MRVRMQLQKIMARGHVLQARMASVLPGSEKRLIQSIHRLLQRQEERDVARYAAKITAGEIDRDFCSVDRYRDYRRNCLSLQFERELKSGFFERSMVTLLDVYQQLVNRLNGVHLLPETICYRSISHKETQDLLANGSVFFRGYAYSQASLICFEECLGDYGTADDYYSGIILEILTGGKFKACEEYFYESRIVTETEHRPEIRRVFVVSEGRWMSVDAFRQQYSSGEQ